MFEWNYLATTNKETGYEKYTERFKEIRAEYQQANNETQKSCLIDEVFNIYRTENIFPIFYFNTQGIYDEIQKCIDKKVYIENNSLTFKYLQGTDLCKFLFPNLFLVESGDINNNSLYKKFTDNHKLRRAVELALNMNKNAPNPTEIRNKLELIGGNVATNFHPMKAKAIYEKYCPPNGIIYDFACGFGGRMLGALTSTNNYKYYGVEPCTETFVHLNELGQYIEQYTHRNNSYKIICKGSEEYCCSKNYCDFAFSSPCYFNLERYSDEPTQSFNKFSTLDSWLKGFVKPTIENVYYMLKPNCYYAVNIADFNMGNKRIEYVNNWIKLSEIIGFTYVEKIDMKVETRKGVGHSLKNPKQEGIYIFKKEGN